MAPLRYEYPLDRYIHALKFLPDRRMGRALGLLLADHLATNGADASVSALVPVPLHRRRLLQRGFNQAFEIARPIASGTNLPLLVAGIHRRVSTQPQTLINAHKRNANVRSVFQVRRRLDGLTIAIIDDVITTGATVNSLARALRGAGATDVHAWAVARAPPSANG